MYGTRPRRAPNLRFHKDSPYASRLLSVLLIAGTFGSSSSALLCCPENTLWVAGSRNCSDGNSLQLHCPGAFYSVNPEENHFDEFKIVESFDGDRLEFLHNWEPIEPGRFCVSGKNEESRFALACFDDDESFLGDWKHTVFGILSTISALFFLLTLIVYLVLPELQDIQGKAISIAVAFFTASYIILAVQQMGLCNTGDAHCIPIAFLLYWNFLSAFFWMNLVAFNVWRCVWFKTFPIKDSDMFLMFCAIGFIGPGIFLIAALVAHHTDGDHLKPRFGENTCWFYGWYETWGYFYGPVAILLSLNVIYLGLTCWRLWFEYRGYTGNSLRTLRFNCLLYLKLILVMGITWIFEVISYAVSHRDNDWYWFATDILNTLQGLVIFLVLVAMRKRVKRLLARRRWPFGITFPKSWAAYEQDEEIVPALDVEMELSNSP